MNNERFVAAMISGGVPVIQFDSPGVVLVLSTWSKRLLRGASNDIWPIFDKRTYYTSIWVIDLQQ